MLPPKRRRRVLSNILPPGGGVTLRPPVCHANRSDTRPAPGQPLRGSAGSDTKLALHHVGGGVYSLRPPCSEEAPRERGSHTCPTRCPSHPGSGARRVRKAPTVDVSALVDTTWRRPKAANGVPVTTPQPSQTRGPEGGHVRGALSDPRDREQNKRVVSPHCASGRWLRSSRWPGRQGSSVASRAAASWGAPEGLQTWPWQEGAARRLEKAGRRTKRGGLLPLRTTARTASPGDSREDLTRREARVQTVSALSRVPRGKSPLCGFRSSEDRIEKAYLLRGPSGTPIVPSGARAHFPGVDAAPSVPQTNAPPFGPEEAPHPAPLHDHTSSEVQRRPRRLRSRLTRPPSLP